MKNQNNNYRNEKQVPVTVLSLLFYYEPHEKNRKNECTRQASIEEIISWLDKKISASVNDIGCWRAGIRNKGDAIKNYWLGVRIALENSTQKSNYSAAPHLSTIMPSSIQMYRSLPLPLLTCWPACLRTSGTLISYSSVVFTMFRFHAE